MYTKILVPFDQSLSSSRALQHAAELAKKVGAQKLSIIHATPRPMVEEMVTNLDLYQLMDDENEVILKPAIEFLKNDGLNYEVHTFLGDPAHVILEYQEKHHYDLIVMGRTGKGLLKRAMLGSVSNRVLHEVHCPVLIVK